MIYFSIPKLIKYISLTIKVRLRVQEVLINTKSNHLQLMNHGRLYKRQMDMYVWIAHQKGFDVSNTSYFVYVDAQHKDIDGMFDKQDPSIAWMKFNASIIPYEADPSWVEPTLVEIKGFLMNQSSIPDHTPKGDDFSGCDLGRYADEMIEALKLK